jgi:3-dehydroquinate synthetase
MGDIMETVKVTASKEYLVHIGAGFLDSIGEKIKGIKRLCRVVLVSDDIVFSLYGEKVKKSLTTFGLIKDRILYHLKLR